jgi:hypothetical protein
MKALDHSISVRGFVEDSEGLSEFLLEGEVVVEQRSNLVFVVVVIYVLDQVGSNPFGGSSSHKAGHERGVVVVVHVVAVELEVEIELEDLFLELVSISVVKVRSGNLAAVALNLLGFLRGVHRSVTHLKGVQSVKIVLR